MSAAETDAGIALVDRWRVQREHRSKFLALYQEHVLDVVRSLDGFQRSTVLGAFEHEAGGPVPWDLEVIYEFTDDSILDRFHDQFASQYRESHPGRTVRNLLDELEPWVTAHDDSTMTPLSW